MNQMTLAFNTVRTSDSAVNSVLRNTYFLLSLCLLTCSAATFASIVTQVMPGFLVMIIGTYGLLFLVHKYADSGLGILFSLLFSAFLGFTLGPIVSYSLALPAGSFILLTSIGTTGLVFLSLSAYVLQTRQDFSFMSGMVFIGFMVVFALMMLNFIFNIPAMFLVISAFIAMLSSASILLHTSLIINGGERNYILATVSLFVAIYNLFLSILQILMFFSGSSRD